MKFFATQPPRPRLACLSALIIGLAACGQAIDVDSGGSSGSTGADDPTSDVVDDIGPVNEAVLNDVETYALSISGEIDELLSENFGYRDDTNNFLIAPRGINDSGSDEPLNEEVEITREASICDEGGTKQLAGTLDMEVLQNSDSGSLTGTFAIIYTACVEAVSLTTSDGSCTVSTQLDGTVLNAVTLNFTNLADFDNDVFEIHLAVETSGPLSFAIEDGGTQSLTYDYTLYLNSRYLGSPETNGSLSFGSQNFDVVGVADFVSATTASAVCP